MLEIFTTTKNGFDPVIENDGWKVAFITYSDMYSKTNFKNMKRHINTDEVFILLNGKATLHIASDLSKGITAYELEKKFIYNVKRNTWHYLSISKDALLSVIESYGGDKNITETITI